VGDFQVSAYHERLRKVYGAKADSIIAKIGKDTKSGTPFAVNQIVYAKVDGQLQSMVYDKGLALRARQAEEELAKLPEAQRPKPMFTEGRRFRTEN